ncbi:MAG: STAS domain-containing protein [Kiritimatiellia bacterium]|nr:STAS domain-containing protein [Lentisphaerota bacterium]
MHHFSYDADTRTLTGRLYGRLDTAACQELAAALAAELQTLQANPATNEGLHLTLDMAEVTFIASAFFRICMSTVRKLPAENFAIINSSDDIKRAFKLVELDYFFKIS